MRTPLLLALALAAPAAADPPAPKRQAATVAYFSSLQEVGPFTADEMAERKASGGLDAEGQIADAALNDWKLCVLESLGRWAELKPGPGTLVDGAFGRCADRERGYRDSLLKVTSEGRPTIDLNLAKAMMRMLEDVWRPRLIAAALDGELAALKPPLKGTVTVDGGPDPAPAPPRERRR